MFPSLGWAQPSALLETCEIKFFRFGGGNFEGLIYFSEPNHPEPIELSAGRRSLPYSYRGPAQFSLARSEADPATGQIFYRKVASVNLVSGAREQLLVVMGNPAFDAAILDPDVPEFLVYSIDDGESNLPADHLAFYNKTGAPLLGVLGETSFELGDGLSEPMDVSKYFGQRQVLVGLAVQYMESHRVVLQTRTRFFPRRRLLIVLLPPSEDGRLEITAFKIEDAVHPKEDASETGRQNG